MDAAADYAAVRRALTNANLPAYVSYVVRSHAGFDAIHGDDTTTIVVRTSDGKIISGKPPKIEVASGHEYGSDVVRHGPFDPACYQASSATLTTFESHAVEAIALRAVCHEKHDTDHSDDTEFTTLYADPVTHRPLAVVGADSEQFVNVHLDERFVVASGFVLPATFTVKIAGSGPMFWLNVDARVSFSDYRFMSALP